MNIPLLVLVLILVSALIWLVGLLVYGYHVFSYGLPGDATKKSLSTLLLISAFVFLVITFFLSGIDWGSL